RVIAPPQPNAKQWARGQRKRDRSVPWWFRPAGPSRWILSAPCKTWKVLREHGRKITKRRVERRDSKRDALCNCRARSPWRDVRQRRWPVLGQKKSIRWRPGFRLFIPKRQF